MIKCPKCLNSYEATKTYFDTTRLNSVLRNKRDICICRSCCESRQKLQSKPTPQPPTIPKSKLPPSTKPKPQPKKIPKPKSAPQPPRPVFDKKWKTLDFPLLDGTILEEIPYYVFHSYIVHQFLNGIKENPKDKAFVYVIGPEEGPYKIGITRNVKVRLGELQVGCWYKIKVHFSLESLHARHTEEVAHRFLREHKLHGEWFQYPLEKIIHMIKTIYEKTIDISEKKFEECVLNKDWLDYLEKTESAA